MEKYLELEAEFAKFVGTRHAVAVNTGTAALHLALAALGVGPGDEVIVPEFTMIACAYAVIYCGATPVYVDCDDSLNIDPKLLAAAITPRTRAIMPVHVYGWPCDMGPIMDAAGGIPVVEDCSEAHGAVYRGRNVGSIGKVGCFSLYRNKIVHAEEGGVVTTDDATLAARMRDMRNMSFGARHDYMHGGMGFNYRMTNGQAALALESLANVRESLHQRELVAQVYDEAFSGRTVPRPPGGVTWMYPVWVPEDRQEAVAASAPGVRHFFKPMSSQPLLGQSVSVGAALKASRFSRRGVYLPVRDDMTLEEVLDVSGRVVAALAM